MIQSLIADAMSRALDNIITYRNDNNMQFKVALQIHDAVLLQVPIAEIEHVHDHVLPECMSRRVPIIPADLSGFPLPGRGPYYLGIDSEIYLKWGIKVTKDECATHGIPSRFGK